jgi:hypothetical protein
MTIIEFELPDKIERINTIKIAQKYLFFHFIFKNIIAGFE